MSETNSVNEGVLRQTLDMRVYAARKNNGVSHRRCSAQVAHCWLNVSAVNLFRLHPSK